jgi:hypothetical protein
MAITTGYKSIFRSQAAPRGPVMYTGWCASAFSSHGVVEIKQDRGHVILVTGAVNYGYRKRLLKTI